MKLTVVTACYNSEQTIRTTIASFLIQTHLDRELLIIDGASCDETLSIVASYASPDIRIISERDSGVYDAMNKGLRQFSGDAVGFLNSDDALHDEHALARIAQALEQADIAYGDLLMVTDHESKTVVREWRAGRFSHGAFQRGWQPPHPGFFVRRSVVERVGEFDLSYVTAADYDFMMRSMLLDGVRIAYVPHVLADFMMGGLSTRDWRATWRGTLETLRSRRRYLAAPPVDAAVFLRLARRLVQLRRLRNYYAS